MKSKLYIFIFLLSIFLIPSGSVFGGESGFEGEITLRGQLADVEGSEAKFNEYRDIESSVYIDLGLKYDNDKYFMNFEAFDVMQETQKYTLDGGMWGKFRYDLYYMEIPHNITYGAKTFLSGAGSDLLIGTVTNTSDPATWSTFDYSTARQRYGAGLKLDVPRPFFVDFEVTRETKTGIKIGGGEGNVELPEPVDYTTNTVGIEAGYNKRPFFASLSYFYSSFDNDNRLLFSIINGTTRALTLPPDNHFERYGFKGAVMLPLNSRFSTNIGIGQARSDFRLVSSAGVPLGETFHGKVDSRNYDFVLTTNPVSMVDGKVFYKYYSDKNKSDEIDNNLLSYKKTSYGAEVGFRLPQNVKLRASYKRMVTDYSEVVADPIFRVYADKRKDDTYGVDLIWTGLDFLTVRTGYERMNRRTDRLPFVAGVNDPVEPYTGRFDVSPFNRDTFKASVDITPVENLDVTVGYKYKKTDYRDTILGIRDDKRNEFYADANYAIGKIANVFGYFDYEKVEYFQFQRAYLAPNDNPDGVTDASNYNWTINHEEKNFDYGIGLSLMNIYPVPRKLIITMQYDYVKSDGNADLTYLFAGALPAGATNDNIDISNSDDYRKKSFSVKAVYNVSKPLTLTLGYAYERYKYSDVHYDDFRYMLFDGGTLRAVYTGALANSSYQANVVYLGLTYKF